MSSNCFDFRYRKGFLQVSIAPEHRDFLRFLWVSDVNEAHPKIVIKRMTRAMFGVTSSPFLLGGTLQHHISKYEEEDPEIVKKLLESFYVDDSNSGEENVDQAFELYLKSNKILSDGGFTLRKWSSNSNELLELIRKNEPDATTITNTEESQEESSYAESCLVIRIKTCKLRESKRFWGYCGIQKRTLLLFGSDISLIWQIKAVTSCSTHKMDQEETDG